MDSILAAPRRRVGGARLRVAATLAAACLASCQQSALREPDAVVVDAATGAAAIYRIDPTASEIHILVYRTGPFARLGHNHVVAATDPAGQVRVTADLRESDFELSIQVAELAVDASELRQRYGDAFASTPSEEDIAATRRNMLSPALLDATAYPYVRVAGRLSPHPDGNEAEIEIALKNALARRTVPITLRIDDRTLSASGTLTIDHSELGLTPFSVMLGALRVAETMEIRFSLTARRASDG